MRALFPVLLLTSIAISECAGKTPLHELVLPGEVTELKATDRHGVAIISRKSSRVWRHKSGILIQMNMDNSNRATAVELEGYGLDYVRQAREQMKEAEVGDAARYTFGGKAWIWIAVNAKDPAKSPDQIILVTQFKKTLAVVQVGARREQREEMGRIGIEPMKLNSPAGNHKGAK